jgi:hypothetical protein
VDADTLIRDADEAMYRASVRPERPALGAERSATP